MVVYYISYGETPRPPLWRHLLLILLVTLALAVAAAIAYGIYELASGEGSDLVPLAEVLPALYQDDTNATYWIDTSKSISESGYLDEVKKALETVALPYTNEGAGQAAERSQAVLVPFTKVPEPPLNLASLEAPETSSGWLAIARGLEPSDDPAYIYDAIAAAHEALMRQDDSIRTNVIVLLTDQGDGGLREIDPARLAPCPVGIPAKPGEVCSPVLEPIPVDPAKLVPCPAEVAAAVGEVCNPVPGSADKAIVTYERIDLTDLKACPPELGGANVPCYDVVIGYQPVNPVVLEACPPEFAKPGNACMPVQSEINRDDLIFLLATSEVHELRVYIIGLGAEADRVSLELLATAGNGKYIHCTSVSSCQAPE